MTDEEKAREIVVDAYWGPAAISTLTRRFAAALREARAEEREACYREVICSHGETIANLAERIRSRGPAPEKLVAAGADHVPGERSSSEYSDLAIAVARHDGRLRVDKDGLGWIHDMEPDKPVVPELQRACVCSSTGKALCPVHGGDVHPEGDYCPMCGGATVTFRHVGKHPPRTVALEEWPEDEATKAIVEAAKALAVRALPYGGTGYDVETTRLFEQLVAAVEKGGAK